MSHYVLTRNAEGAERLRMLSRILGQSTGDLLRRVGQRCLDVGGGEVTITMARRVGQDGLAVGIDDELGQPLSARWPAKPRGHRGGSRVGRLGDRVRFVKELAAACFCLDHEPG